jgi:hypothetical protein
MAEGAVTSGSGPNAGSRFWARKQGLFGRPVRQIFLGEDGMHVYDRAGTAVKSVPYDGVVEASERPTGAQAPVPGTLRLDLARGGAMKFKFTDTECSARFLGALKRCVLVTRGKRGGGGGGGLRPFFFYFSILCS